MYMPLTSSKVTCVRSTADLLAAFDDLCPVSP